MNRPHGQPYYPPQTFQSSAGPPQPQWQRPPVPPSQPGWRLQPQPNAGNHVSAPGYDPNSYGPMPGSSPSPVSPEQSRPNVPSYSTTAWGVRYNQNQQHGQHQDPPKPTLPPRPTSATGYQYAHDAPSQTHTPTPWSTGSVGTSNTGHEQRQQGNQQYGAGQPTIPPVPPPRPPEYQSQAQFSSQAVPHPQYSQHPPTHQYEPPDPNKGQTMTGENVKYGGQAYQGPQNATALSWAAVPQPEHRNQPVSPVESFQSHWQPAKPVHQDLTSAPASGLPYHTGDTVHRVEDRQNDGSHYAGFATGASAQGGPSDWEYYYSSPRTESGTVPKQAVPNQTTVLQRQSAGLEEQLPSKNSFAHQQQANLFGSALDVQQVSPVSPPTRTSPTPVASLDLNDLQPATVGQSKFTEDELSEVQTLSTTVNGLQRTGTIDGIIDAWSRPLAISRPGTSKSGNERRAVPTINELPPDIDPEYHASLSRFIATLRNEARADSDAERFKIFNAFVQKECRLRMALYNIEEAAKTPPPPTSRASRVGQDMKPAPDADSALPASGDRAQPSAANSTSGLVRKGTVEGTMAEIAVSSPLRPNDSSKVLSLETSPGATDDSFVVVDGPKDESEYSPGGRPRLSRPVATRLESHNSRQATAEESARISTQATVSPIDNAPMFLGDYVTAPPESPGRNAPMVVGSQESGTDAGSQRPGLITSSGQHLKFEPPRPVYTPFRYQEVKQSAPDALAKEEPADQAYSTLRNQTSDSGRLMTQSVPPSKSVGAQDGFVGLLRQQSLAIRSGRSLLPTPAKLRPPTPSVLLPSNPVADAISTIRAFAPDELPDDGDSSKLSEINRDVENVPDQFGFIKDLVLQWDKDTRKLRAKQDEERQTRQEESEAHIDSLFNDNEIGYSDIAAMEADFKLDEAQKKYEEDQQELDSFTKQVFATVTERLENELSRLNQVYVLAVDVLDLESYAASNLLSDATSKNGQEAEKIKASQAMNAVISIFNKIQVRHQKLAEARFERERRRKMLELTVLQANGDRQAVTRLEEDFASAEKLQILQEAQEKDKRANKLVDSFDRAAVRTMAENQAYIDDIHAKLKRLDAIGLKSGASQEAAELRHLLQRVEQGLSFVANDSKQILAMSNIAEKLLNDADYSVSVAKARIQNASDSSLEKLRVEKQKEDDKIYDDFESRQSSLAKGPADALSVRDSILAKLRDDPERQERLQKALEAAKMRNANKEV